MNTETVNNYRRRNNRKYAVATNYLFNNYSNMVRTKHQYNVSIAEQLEVQCEIPLEVAQHIVGSKEV